MPLVNAGPDRAIEWRTAWRSASDDRVPVWHFGADSLLPPRLRRPPPPVFTITGPSMPERTPTLLFCGRYGSHVIPTVQNKYLRMNQAKYCREHGHIGNLRQKAADRRHKLLRSLAGYRIRLGPAAVQDRLVPACRIRLWRRRSSWPGWPPASYHTRRQMPPRRADPPTARRLRPGRACH